MLQFQSVLENELKWNMWAITRNPARTAAAATTTIPTVGNWAFNSFPLLTVLFVLVFFCCHHLFQRKKRSVSEKKKRSRKSLSKSKPKLLSLSAFKKSSAKKFAAKKKRQIPGYQATAPARPRGNFRVKVQRKRKKTKSHQDLPVMRGENLWWKTPELSNLFSVDVVVSSQPASWLASKQITWREPLN